MGSLTLDDMIDIALREKYSDKKTYNQQRLGTQAQRYCRTVTSRFCADLPEDLHLDIFQQAFVELFALEHNAIAARGGRAVFRRCVLNAIRIVKSGYAAPGVRTRKTRKELAPKRIAAEHIGQMVEGEMLAHCTVQDGVHRRIDFDLIASQAAALEMQQVEDRLDLQKMLCDADPLVVGALYLICVDGERVDYAAADAGFSRFALKRRFAALTSACLHAA